MTLDKKIRLSLTFCQKRFLQKSINRYEISFNFKRIGRVVEILCNFRKKLFIGRAIKSDVLCIVKSNHQEALDSIHRRLVIDWETSLKEFLIMDF